jgi:outer membrane protein assembly factor BamB
LLAMDATSDDFTPLYDAKITPDGRLIGGDDLRAELGLNKAGSSGEDLATAEKTWQREAVNSGPVACTTPAFSDGKIVLRLKKSLVCFDLNANSH